MKQLKNKYSITNYFIEDKTYKISNYSNIIFTDKDSFNGKSWLIIYISLM